MVVSTSDAAATAAADFTDSALLDDAARHAPAHVTNEAGEDCTPTLMLDWLCVYLRLGCSRSSRTVLPRESPFLDISPTIQHIRPATPELSHRDTRIDKAYLWSTMTARP